MESGSPVIRALACGCSDHDSSGVAVGLLRGGLFAFFAFGDAAYVVYAIVVECDGEECVGVVAAVVAGADCDAAGG